MQTTDWKMRVMVITILTLIVKDDVIHGPS